MPSLRRAAATGAACLAIAVLPTPVRAATFEFTGIRPGTLLYVPHSMSIGGRQVGIPDGCTANFVFQTTGNAFDKTQQLYLGTAGHCLHSQSVQAIVVPPGGGAPVLITIGTVEQNFFPADDFGLIKIDLALNDWVSPSMAEWGGPTAAYSGTGTGPVEWVGNGGFVGGAVPRTGTGSWSATTLGVVGTVDIAGDSGSPVTTSDGLAVGSLVGVAGATGQAGVPADTFAQGPSIARMLTLAGHPLATCSSADPWRLPGCP